MTRTNWGGNHAYAAEHLLQPECLDELHAAVTGHERVKVVATGHSFNAIADTDGAQISLSRMPVDIRVETRADGTGQVTASGWATYAQVSAALYDRGLALHTMASLPHISVAGATATATHGSGLRNPSLAAPVTAIELINGRGDPVRVSRETTADFSGHVVHLGALGVVTSMTLDAVPAVPYHQRAYLGLSLSVLAERPLEVLGAAESVSCFTRWQGDVAYSVIIKGPGDPADDPAEIAGAVATDETLHPTLGVEPAGVTQQGGVPGPWHARLPHFRPDHQPSTGREIQSEWFVALAHAGAVIEAVSRVGHLLDHALQGCELRTVAGDDLWLSAANGRDVLALHFTWRPDPALVLPAVEVVERALTPYDALPHWGKVWHRASGSHRRYPRLDDFLALAEKRDPDGRFRNRFLSELAGA